MQCKSSKAIHLDSVLVMARRLHYCSRSIPICWVSTSLVLEEHSLPNGQVCGVDGGEQGRGGVAACDGSFMLQSMHFSLVLWMSFDVVPLQRFPDALHGGA